MKNMFIFLVKKIAVPSAKELCCISWMYNRGHIAVGGVEGTLRVFLLPSETESKHTKSPYKVHHYLEGHTSNAKVTLVSWNEVNMKLASSDDAGLIIVWMSHANEDAWFEEMINNRQKSTVVALKWSNDGSKIAIAYEDGQVIVGSVDGNRLWSKDIASPLASLAWNTDDTLLLLGLQDGEVHAYDLNGNFLLKVPMMAIESVELEAALAKDLKKDTIVSMEWFVPTKPCRLTDQRPLPDQNGAMGTILPRVIKQDTFSGDDPMVFRGKVPEDRPRFLVAYQNGLIQLMRNEADPSPVICRLPSTIVVMCRWSPDGTIFAVGGYQTDLPEDERNVMHFITASGAKLQTMKLSSGRMAGFAWEGSGLRLAILIDNNFYLAVVKPAYKWTYCGQTVVYRYESEDTGEETLVFYETKMDEMFRRQVRDLCCMAAYDDHCVVICQIDEVGGAYLMQLCDSIGTPVDSKSMNIQPTFVTMNNSVVIVANLDSFMTWHFTLPRKSAIEAYKAPPKEQSDTIYHIDQFREEAVKRAGRVADNICCLCAGTDFFLVGRDSGAVHRYSLPEVKLQYRYQLGHAAESMALNCTGRRLAIITKHHVLKFYDIKDNAAAIVPNFEKRDVWDMKWDMEKEDAMVCMEKQKVVVIQGTDAEEPVYNNGYLCSFRDLQVRNVLMDDLLRDPENPSKVHIIDIEIKILRTAKELLDNNRIAEATAFIDEHSHPKLWNLLATVALNKMELKTAEHAFVKLQDYGGIQFLKRLDNIQSEALKKAEICTFLGDLDAAERIYFENDRRDLAIDMRKKMFDWFRVLQILQTSSGPGDDILLQQAWKHVGNYFMERQKWYYPASVTES